jgi:hypothetical protein
VTAPRLHALQGRANVECPKCGHALALHIEGRCTKCVHRVEVFGWAESAADAALGLEGSRMGAPYSLCADRSDDPLVVQP